MSCIYLFRDWFFDLLLDYFIKSGWAILIKDFKRSKNKRERCYFGLTNYREKIVYLDKFHATPRILVHELGHMALGDLLENYSKVQPKSELQKLQVKKLRHKRREWAELETMDFERLFFKSLTKQQISILKDLINIAKSMA